MCVPQNVTVHYVAPPIFVFFKYVILPTTLCLYNIETKTQTIFKSTYHYVFSKYAPHILPLVGDTPFYAFGYEIEDFYLTRKKTGRRYGLRSKFILRYCLYTCVYPYLMRRDVARRYKFCRLIYKHNTSVCSHSHCYDIFV